MLQWWTHVKTCTMYKAKSEPSHKQWTWEMMAYWCRLWQTYHCVVGYCWVEDGDTRLLWFECPPKPHVLKFHLKFEVLREWKLRLTIGFMGRTYGRSLGWDEIIRVELHDFILVVFLGEGEIRQTHIHSHTPRLLPRDALCPPNHKECLRYVCPSSWTSGTMSQISLFSLWSNLSWMFYYSNEKQTNTGIYENSLFLVLHSLVLNCSKK